MKWRIWASALSLATIVSFVGAVSGTLAWYAYTTNVNVSYGGTSVYQTEELQIGFVVPKSYTVIEKGKQVTHDIDLVESDKYELDTEKNDSVAYPFTTHYKLKDSEVSDFVEKTEVDTDEDGTVDKVYWFCEGGTGMSSEAVYIYTQAMKDVPGYGYSFSSITPVTTRVYKTGDTATFNKAPTAGEKALGVEADHDNYCRMDFAFRVSQTDLLGHDRFLSGKDLYLRGVGVETRKGETRIDSAGAVRVYFESNEGSFVFNPSSENDGATKVGGVLDLNGDGYYDYNATNPYADVSNGDYFGYEYIYGDYTVNDGSDETNKATYYSTDTESQQNYASDETLPSTKSTFLGSHRAGVKGYDDYSAFTLGESEYLGTKTVYPYSKQGALTGGKVLSTTSNSPINPVAELTTAIYLEGWDHAVIDNILDVNFECVLDFQIGE